MLRLAHRGDWRRAPENTLPALLAALKVPACDGLEFDVRLAADGVPVILHDKTLARVQGRPEPVGELQARALEDLGVPSLADVLAAIPHRAFLDVELKGRHDRAVVEVLAAGRGPGLVNAVVSSFKPETLERVAGLVPSVAALAQRPGPGASDDRGGDRARVSGDLRGVARDRSGVHGSGPRRRPGGRGLDPAPARHGREARAARGHRDQRGGGCARRVTARRDVVRCHVDRAVSCRPRSRR